MKYLGFSKIFTVLLFIIFYLIITFFLIYILSGFLLIANITPNNKLIKNYQRNFYLHSGLRNIWQNRKDCVEYDKELVFVPQKKTCNFKNLEFKTNISFNEEGRFSYHPNKKLKNGIIVLGDSHSMGWGVNDNETFSAILEKKIKRPVYNLAVSGYGTPRELIRLQKSNVIDYADTIVIQYSYNDYGENKSYQIRDDTSAKETFDLMTSNNSLSFFEKLRKSFRYSLTIPIDIIINNNKLMDFNDHIKLFETRLKESELIKDKKILVFYINGYDIKFINFPNGKSINFSNLFYYDLDIGEKYTFSIDGHLDNAGHRYVAEELYKILN